MQIQVHISLDETGAEKLRRVRFDGREISVADNIDQWHGAGYDYFKVRGDDGNLYILRHSKTSPYWELTMYERA